MNDRAAEVYDLLFSSIDYAAGARRVHEIVQGLNPGASTLLDVGCGAGRHLEHFSNWYLAEGVDLSEVMLRQARALLPAIPLHKGDMRDFDLGRRFDAVVCLTSSIAYMTTFEDLCRAVANMAGHLKPGGVLIVEPWDSPEGYESPAEPYLATYEDAGRKIVMLERMILGSDAWEVESHYLIGTAGGIDYFVENQKQGAFTHAENLAAFERAGLEASYDPVGLLNRGLYIGTRTN